MYLAVLVMLLFIVCGVSLLMVEKFRGGGRGRRGGGHHGSLRGSKLNRNSHPLAGGGGANTPLDYSFL